MINNSVLVNIKINKRYKAHNFLGNLPCKYI